MTTRSKIEKWLLADWNTGHNVQVASEDVKVLTLEPNEGSRTEGIVFELPHMDQQLRLKTNDTNSRDENIPREGRDYSPSVSSWAPSDGGTSSEESDRKEAHTKTIKVEQYIRQYSKRRNGKNVPVPVHRPNAVVDVLKERQNTMNNRLNDQSRKRKYKETSAGNRSLPDSTKKHLPPKDTVGTISINRQNILDIKASFEELFKMIDNMKPVSERRRSKYFNNTTANLPSGEKTTSNHVYKNIEAFEQSDKSHGEESNRSDDNVLISNKYSQVCESLEDQPQKDQHIEEDEWVAIGSGKTLIHKDKYRKVNWRSYTIATRTLLLATFPRRILATHSLTGKRSPAFQNKPAKMCLDPKIVSDIIIEITSKFNVKENLVRSAITTKCADECKMYKTRTQNKNKLIKHQETATLSQNPKQSARLVKTE